MALTYEAIATTTLGSSSATISFTSIPSTYTDLRLIVAISSATVNGTELWIRFNGVTGNSYSWTYLSSDGATATTNGSAPDSVINLARAATVSNSIPSFADINIFNYPNTAAFKTVLSAYSGDRNGSGGVERNVGQFSSTSAITSLELSLRYSASFNAGTSATLYGIKAA